MEWTNTKGPGSNYLPVACSSNKSDSGPFGLSRGQKIGAGGAAQNDGEWRRAA